MRVHRIGALVAFCLVGADAFTSSLIHLGSRSLPVLHAPMSLPRPHRRVFAYRSGSTKMQLKPAGRDGGKDSSNQGLFTMDSLAKPTVAAAWLLYMQHIFLSDAPCGVTGGEMCGISLPVTMEAINLSINFWFITPIVFPSMAPVIHPTLEALFNIVVAWGALFVGFLSDGRGQKVPMLPFMVGTAFLTNVFYLPYLVLRTPGPAVLDLDDPAAASETQAKALALGEARAWPVTLLAVFAASVAWGAVGRGGDYGDLATRWNALVDMATHTDRLAHSFLVDSLTFWAFQGWLVPDDMQRRNFEDRRALAAARAVPFFGLAYYLLVRPPLPGAEEA